MDNVTITSANGEVFKGYTGVNRVLALTNNAQGRINPLPKDRAGFVLLFDVARPEYNKRKR